MSSFPYLKIQITVLHEFLLWQEYNLLIYVTDSALVRW